MKSCLVLFSFLVGLIVALVVVVRLVLIFSFYFLVSYASWQMLGRLIALLLAL